MPKPKKEDTGAAEDAAVARELSKAQKRKLKKVQEEKEKRVERRKVSNRDSGSVGLTIDHYAPVTWAVEGVPGLKYDCCRFWRPLRNMSCPAST